MCWFSDWLRSHRTYSMCTRTLRRRMEMARKKSASYLSIHSEGKIYSNICRINGKVICFYRISIAIMIFINFGAGGYQFFDHAAWNGLHMADLAFPWFMWIMGFCIPISLSSSFKKDLPNSQMLWNILKVYPNE